MAVRPTCFLGERFAQGKVTPTNRFRPLVLAGGTQQVPVNSADDPNQALVNRISAVDDIVIAMDARIGRIIASRPPNPCEPELCAGLLGARFAFGTLLQTTTDACFAQSLSSASDVPFITDGDVFAADASETGLLNQLAAVGTVLANANDRLGRITEQNPGPPDTGALAAYAALYDNTAIGFDALTVAIGDDVTRPPNPCQPRS